MSNYKVSLEQFSGPLDLLLGLIQEEKLDITQISLAEIADEFVTYIEKNNEIPAEELADFLVVASKLLLIKSKVLLPHLHLEGEEEASELERQLKMYKEYADVALVINKMALKRRFLYHREGSTKSLEVKFAPPPKLKSEILAECFQQIINNLRPLIVLPKKIIAKTILLKDKLARLQKLLGEKTEFLFNHLVDDIKDRVDVVVSFLAMLEMVKQRTVEVKQEKIFTDITIKRK